MDDTIVILRILRIRRILDVDTELCLCFIDWQKACAGVNWTKLRQILKVNGIEWRARRRITKMYMYQADKLK
jgi:hypothetical protein